MTLQEAQAKVDQWIKEYGICYFSELTNMTILTEEVGELAWVMARKYGDQSFKKGEEDRLAEEMADVLWVLVCMANQTGVDLTAAFEETILKKPFVTKKDISIILNLHPMDDNFVQDKDKYELALSLYKTEIDDEWVKRESRQILSEHLPENNHSTAKRLLLNCLDLTRLNTMDTEEELLSLTEKVNLFSGEYGQFDNVASICVYPSLLPIVRDTLEADEVKIAAVSGGFSHSQTFIEVKIAEIALCLQEGANEIDYVLSVGKLLSGDFEGLCEEIEEIKAVCKDCTLKVILETGALQKASLIKKAAILSLYSEADFLKTSTGKQYTPATPEAAFVICQTLKEYHELTGRKVGFKAAGGVKNVQDALVYYTLVKELLGPEWLFNQYFRIGSSHPGNQLLTDLTQREVHFF